MHVLMKLIISPVIDGSCETIFLCRSCSWSCSSSCRPSTTGHVTSTVSERLPGLQLGQSASLDEGFCLQLLRRKFIPLSLDEHVWSGILKCVCFYFGGFDQVRTIKHAGCFQHASWRVVGLQWTWQIKSLWVKGDGLCRWLTRFLGGQLILIQLFLHVKSQRVTTKNELDLEVVLLVTIWCQNLVASNQPLVTLVSDP